MTSLQQRTPHVDDVVTTEDGHVDDVVATEDAHVVASKKDAHVVAPLDDVVTQKRTPTSMIRRAASPVARQLAQRGPEQPR